MKAVDLQSKYPGIFDGSAQQWASRPTQEALAQAKPLSWSPGTMTAKQLSELTDGFRTQNREELSSISSLPVTPLRDILPAPKSTEPKTAPLRSKPEHPDVMAPVAPSSVQFPEPTPRYEFTDGTRPDLTPGTGYNPVIPGALPERTPAEQERRRESRENSKASFGTLMEKPRERVSTTVVGEDAYGNPRIQSEQLADDIALRKRIDERGGVASKDEMLQQYNTSVGIERTRNSVNDLVHHTRNLLRNQINDPYDPDDDPTSSYWVYDQDGNKQTFRVNHDTGVDTRKSWYTLKSGERVTGADIKMAKDRLESGEGPTHYRLPDGTMIRADEVDSIVPVDAVVVSPEDPRAERAQRAEDGNLYYAEQYQVNRGTEQPLYLSAEELDAADPRFVGEDGVVFSTEDIPEDLSTAFEGITTPDGSVLLVNKDGSIPDEVKNRVYSRQDHALPLGFGFENPRSPVQDRAGNYMWEVGKFNPREIAWDEGNASMANMLLSSLPYFFGPKVTGLVASANSAPYLEGFDNDTYLPAPGRWGEGTYANDRITNAEMVGGIGAEAINALAERGLSKLTGGGGKLVGGRNLFPKMKGGEFASNVLWESAEEALSGPAELLKETGWENYGRPGYYNEIENEWVYDESQPNHLLSLNALSNYLANASEGGIMSVGMQAGEAAGRKIGKAGANLMGKRRKGRAEIDTSDIPEAVSIRDAMKQEGYDSYGY